MSSTLDIEQPDALIDYLRTTGRISSGERPFIRVLPGGVSSRTVLVERPFGSGWVLKQSLPKLRVATDWFSDPARIHREALGLRWLEQLAPPGSVPAFIFEDFEAHLFAMEAIPQPHENWKTMLLAGRVEWEHVKHFGELLGTMHRNARAQADKLAPLFDDRTFFESLRIEPYYLFTASQVPAAATFLHDLVEQTRARRLTLVHGDYSPKNILVRNDRLILLDHEVIHWGDPAFDLGFSMAHFLSKANHVRNMRIQFATSAFGFFGSYITAIGRWDTGLEQQSIRHTLACLLARVAGRSPLEYLSEEERARQRDAVLKLIASPPTTVQNLAKQFTICLSSNN